MSEKNNQQLCLHLGEPPASKKPGSEASGKILKHPKKREYYLANREKKLAYNRAYWAANKDKANAKHAEYRKKNRLKINALNRAYWDKHPEKFKGWRKKWINKNRGVVSSYDANARARQLGVDYDKELIEQFFSWIKNQDFVSCSYCGCFIPSNKVHIDHIVPITRNGAHHPDNFAVACHSCNSSKTDKLLSEWPKCPEKIRNLIPLLGN